jgi:hypothetical protein
MISRYRSVKGSCLSYWRWNYIITQCYGLASVRRPNNFDIAVYVKLAARWPSISYYAPCRLGDSWALHASSQRTKNIRCIENRITCRFHVSKFLSESNHSTDVFHCFFCRASSLFSSVKGSLIQLLSTCIIHNIEITFSNRCNVLIN